MPYPLSLSRNPAGPAARFTLVNIQPPAEDYISPSDQIVLEVLSPLLACNVFLSLRILDLHGLVQVTTQQFTVVPNGAAANVFTTNPSECFLLSANIEVDSAIRGQVFCRLIIQRGQGSSGVSNGEVICQGYASNSDSLSFPKSTNESSLSGVGHVYSITGAVPGLASPAAIIVPAGVRWHVRFAMATLTLVANPITASPEVQSLDAAANLLWQSSTLLSSPAAPSVTVITIADQLQAVPPISFGGLSVSGWALAGGTVQMFIPAMPADASFSALTVTVEEFVEF